MKRALYLVLLLTLGLLISACGPSDGGDTDPDPDPDPEAEVLSYALIDTAYADVSGEVTFEELDNGDIQATIDLGDTAAMDSNHPAHVHVGDAGSGGAIVVALNPVVDGMSVTAFSEFDDGTAVSFEELKDYDGYVNVHLSADDVGIVVASANIGANAEVDVPVPGTIAEVAEEAGDFTILLAALSAAELADTFADADGGPFTVLAPTDAAFADLLVELGVTQEDLLARDDLGDILSYHVLDGAVPESSVVAAATAESDVNTLLEDDPISLSLEGESTVVIDERANVTATNITASNGIIHVIDTVLLPNAETEDPDVTTVEVELSGENEVPAVETDFEGSATVTLEGTTLSVTGSYSEAMVATGAHIHGPAGTDANAGVLFALDYDNDTDAISGTFDLSAGASANEETYTEEQLLGFFTTGQLYINLHTEANASGELRGQIVPVSEED